MAKQGLYLYYLPPYSPELNRTEILWKHAKYLSRRFATVNGADLFDDIQSLMKGFGSEFTINLCDYLAVCFTQLNIAHRRPMLPPSFFGPDTARQSKGFADVKY